ncbi:hypothetical protein E4U42_006849, partial [Claviceps africana]
MKNFILLVSLLTLGVTALPEPEVDIGGDVKRTPGMSLQILQELSAQTSPPHLVGGVTVTVLVLVLAALLGRIWLSDLRSATPRPRRYAVPPPDMPEPETTIKQTGLRVEGHDGIHCYAPATGRFLGFVAASTPRD